VANFFSEDVGYFAGDFPGGLQVIGRGKDLPEASSGRSFAGCTIALRPRSNRLPGCAASWGALTSGTRGVVGEGGGYLGVGLSYLGLEHTPAGDSSPLASLSSAFTSNTRRRAAWPRRGTLSLGRSCPPAFFEGLSPGVCNCRLGQAWSTADLGVGRLSQKPDYSVVCRSFPWPRPRP